MGKANAYQTTTRFNANALAEGKRIEVSVPHKDVFIRKRLSHLFRCRALFADGNGCYPFVPVETAGDAIDTYASN